MWKSSKQPCLVSNPSLFLCDDFLRRINWELVCDGKYDCNDGSDENVLGLCDTSKQCTFENDIKGTFFSESIYQAEINSSDTLMIPQLDHTRREPLRAGKMKVALLGTVATGKYLRTYQVLSPCATFWIMRWRCPTDVVVNRKTVLPFNIDSFVLPQLQWQRVWVDLENATSVTIYTLNGTS